MAESHTMLIPMNKLRSSSRAAWALNSWTTSLALFSLLLAKKIPLACNWLVPNFPRGVRIHYIHYNSLIFTIPTLPSTRIKGTSYHAQCHRILSYICLHIRDTTTLLKVSVVLHTYIHFKWVKCVGPHVYMEFRGKFLGIVFYFYHMGLWDGTQIIKLSNKHLYHWAFLWAVFTFLLYM